MSGKKKALFRLSVAERHEVIPMEKTSSIPRIAVVVAAIAIMLLILCLPAKAQAATVDLSNCSVSISEDWWINFNSEKGPSSNDVVVKKSDGTILDKSYYNVELSDYREYSTYFRVNATVTGNGILAYGSRSVRLSQDLISIEDATLTLSQKSYEYTGKPCEPAVTATYKGRTLSGRDYSYEYSYNTDPGSASVKVKGENAFCSYRSTNYDIRLNLSKCAVKVSPSKYEYIPISYLDEQNRRWWRSSNKVFPSEIQIIAGDGKVMTGNFFTYSIENNNSAGTASVVVSGRNSHYYGRATGKFTITPLKVKFCRAPNDLECTGKKLKLPVSLFGGKGWDMPEPKEGRDYTIKYSRTPKAVGTYTATITFKGNYSGKFKKKFKILPGSPTVKNTKATKTQAKVSWKKAKGATGYKVYRWNKAKGRYTLYKTTKSTSCVIKRRTKYDQLLDIRVVAYAKTGGKTYAGGSFEKNVYLKPSKPTFSVKSTGFGTVDVKFKAEGRYQVQVSSNSIFKRGFDEYVRSEVDNSKYFSFYGFDNTDRVYVRARWYLYDGNKLIVGPWSATKSCSLY